MKMLDLAWQKVKTSTIVNCFAKAGISKNQQKSAQSDYNDPLRDLQNQIEKLVEFYPNFTTKMSFLQSKTWCVQYLF